MTNRLKRAKAFYILLGLGLVIFILLLLKNNSLNLTKQKEEQDAKGKVQSFYAKWLAKDSLTPWERARDLEKEGYLTDSGYQEIIDKGNYNNQNVPGGIDLPTCSQNPLPASKYIYSSAYLINKNSASITLTGRYGGPPAMTQRIEVGLIKESNKWIIDSFKCQR